METKNQDIKVYALGGLGEVGKNCYGVEYGDQIFLIDCGILFPDELLPGVDYVIPDFTYLIQNQKKIVGLFITHGHEDHIGGIPYLAKQLKLHKIYASGIAVDLIKAKFDEFKEVAMPKIIEYNSNSKFQFKNVHVSFIRLNHSIPDMHAIVIDTPLGPIVHTGDFKVDFTPVGPLAEYDKVTNLGQKGVLLMLADSTNATVEGYSKSEQKVGESIQDMFSSIKGRIIIATFASNLYRIEQIVEASKKNNRKIAVFGKSMEKMIEIGIKTGYINATKKHFVEPEKISKFKDEELTILCTGSQGEPLAALSRIASGNHKYISIHEGDTIIFSSSPIPGNGDSVNNTINLLFKAGANVIVNSPFNDTHTSGHANQGELKIIHSLFKPKYFMPIHGEYRMQKIHAKLAYEMGMPKENIFILDNGDILHINKEKAYIKGEVESGETYIDGNQIGASSNMIKERKILSNDGFFSFIFLVNNKKELIGDVNVVSRGFIYMKENEDLTKDLIKEAKDYVTKELEKMKKKDLKALENKVAIYMSKHIEKVTGRKPMVIIMINEA